MLGEESHFFSDTDNNRRNMELDIVHAFVCHRVHVHNYKLIRGKMFAYVTHRQKLNFTVWIRQTDAIMNSGVLF
jgi:hypothetical protein